MADAAIVWSNLGCAPDCLLSFSVPRVNRLHMEEFVKMKEAVPAAAMLALATLLLEASEETPKEEEGMPPEEWMVDDVSLEPLTRVWICLVCWWVTENANLNLNGI